MSLSPAHNARLSMRSRRVDLADGRLRMLVLAAVGVLVVYFLAKPWLGPAFHRAGSPLLQSMAILGALLLLVPFLYVVMKRGGHAEIPNRGLIAHIIASLAGAVLVAVHSTGTLFNYPSVMLYALAGLVITGAAGRLRLSRDMATTLGRKEAAFAPPDPALKAELRKLIAAKTALLAKLDPTASEATFSVNLRHWRRSPRLAFAYARLAAKEARLIGARSSVGQAQAWWRVVHLTLAGIFLLALVVHVVTVTFFAGYVAGGRTIYWWHIAQW